MTSTPADIRAQVMERIIEVIGEAQDQGRDGVAAAKAAFPGTPTIVLWEAWTALEMREVESWWQGVEKTIDGEIIERALADQGSRR